MLSLLTMLIRLAILVFFAPSSKQWVVASRDDALMEQRLRSLEDKSAEQAETIAVQAATIAAQAVKIARLSGEVHQIARDLRDMTDNSTVIIQSMNSNTEIIESMNSNIQSVSADVEALQFQLGDETLAGSSNRRDFWSAGKRELLGATYDDDYDLPETILTSSSISTTDINATKLSATKIDVSNMTVRSDIRTHSSGSIDEYLKDINTVNGKFKGLWKDLDATAYYEDFFNIALTTQSTTTYDGYGDPPFDQLDGPRGVVTAQISGTMYAFVASYDDSGVQGEYTLHCTVALPLRVFKLTSLYYRTNMRSYYAHM